MAWLKRTYYCHGYRCVPIIAMATACHGYCVPIITMATAVRLVMMEELNGDKLDVRSMCESLDVPVSNNLRYSSHIWLFRFVSIFSFQAYCILMTK